MSIEQIEIRPQGIPDLGGEDVLQSLVVQAAALQLAQQRRDQLFNLSGQATGINRQPLDARQGLRGLVMRYNVANE